MNKRETHIVTGMTKDLAISRFEPSYVYDARNIRIRTVGNNSTMLSVTNEKGTAEFTLENGSDPVVGTVLGTASFSDTLVIFTKDETYERIYKLVFNEDYTSALSTRLYQGTGLNLQYDHPLETLALFENESIKKVYWVDGVNQPRVINISKTYDDTEADKFNFNREIGADARIKVTKFNSGGEFRPGTVQYCFNYFDKFGQETNIVDVSPLYYISPKDSGLAADDVSSCSFQVTFENLNPNFEYVRLYAIYRSSENATPSVRIVGDYSTSESEVIVHTLGEFEPVERPVQSSDIEVPFENLWVIDSNYNLKYNVNERFGPESGYSLHTITLEENEYLYDDRNDAVYCTYYLERNGEVGLPKQSTIDVYAPANYTPFYYIVNESDAVSHRRTVSSSFTTETLDKGTTIIDTGVYGSTIDAEALLFMGGQYFIAETLADKDNTLFFGNIKSEVPNIGDIKVTIDGVQIELKNLNTYISSMVAGEVTSCAFGFDGNLLSSLTPEVPIRDLENKDIVPYSKDNNRASTAIKTFKARENYRLGFIAQYKTGQWSEVIWLGDFTEEEQSGVNHFFPAEEYSNGVNTYNLTLWGQQFRAAGYRATISSSIANALIENDFIRVAPVVVYPQFSDRLVICQGLLCPSVFSISDRSENSPFAQCDWRFRKGYSWNRIEEEIQCNATKFVIEEENVEGIVSSTYAPTIPFVKFRDGSVESSYAPLDSENFSKYFGTEYYRDPNILTFHSPDIDSSEEILKGDVLPLKLRLVGYTNGGFFSKIYTHPNPDNPSQQVPDSFFTTREVELKSTVHYYINLDTLGFGSNSELLIDNSTKKIPSVFYDVWYQPTVGTFSHYSYNEFFGGPLKTVGFKDNQVNVPNGTPEAANETTYYGWFTYLWHRNGSLNNQPAPLNSSSSSYRTAMYKRKITSEKTIGYTTYLCNPNADTFNYTTIDASINGINIYDPSFGIVFEDTECQKERLYYGSIDKALIPKFLDKSALLFYDDLETITDVHEGDSTQEGYYVRQAGVFDIGAGTVPYEKGSLRVISDSNRGTEAVQMKYASTRHVVVSLDDHDENTIFQLGKPFDTENNHYIFWINDQKTFNGVYLDEGFYEEDATQHIDYSFTNNCIYIGELYRDMTEEQLAARFGGTSKEALAANTWTLAGEAVKLVANQDATLYYKEGDTYFGRYDCLKSYPLTQQDKQSVVSIYSTEIESRVNLDFRYGNTMNLDDNTLVTPENFNLYNHPGYEQTNQYFTYKTLDYDRYIFNSENGRLIQEFPNTITWSLEKTLGEDVDKWTSISLTSTMDLDGTKGEITKLTRFNNEIFAFQESAFAQVLFNSRVQIPVSDGVPVEITNGYKVDGKRYISEHIGMQNKWSLGVTPYSMYFVDDNKNSIFSYNGQLADLSTIKGMKSWSYMDYTKRKSSWTPYYTIQSGNAGYENLRTFYDNIYNEVYFTTDTESLVYSETLGNFTSFLDYGRLPYLGNMGNKFLALTDGETRLHELWAGDYNKFFGEKKGYSLTFVANADPTMDKVFNNLEWRSTSYNGDNYLSHNTFDTLKVWHEHQDTGDITLNDSVGLPTSLKKKFNAFRAFVPRDKAHKMNRIRNSWTYIKLSKEHPDKEKMMFTDLNVDFFE